MHGVHLPTTLLRCAAARNDLPSIERAQNPHPAFLWCAQFSIHYEGQSNHKLSACPDLSVYLLDLHNPVRYALLVRADNDANSKTNCGT